MDLGCGPNPLPGAKYLYDIRDWGNADIKYLDFYKWASFDPVPYRNVYCRHVLEDLRFPEALFGHFKLCQKGWVETPHPIVELTKGVDQQHSWRGFSHHYWFIWSEDGVLNFLPKTPVVEHLRMTPEIDPRDIRCWNTYYLWKDYEFKYKIFQHGIDFDFRDNSYLELLKRGMNA